MSALAELKGVTEKDDLDELKASAGKLCRLIQERNELCKAGKK